MKSAVLIRGTIGAKQKVKDTLKMLNLTKKNTCIVLEDDNKAQLGMLDVCNDFVTYGDLDEKTHKELEKERGDSHPKENVYRLHPPRGGFERKGIKKQYKDGGALGERDTITPLIERMI